MACQVWPPTIASYCSLQLLQPFERVVQRVGAVVRWARLGDAVADGRARFCFEHDVSAAVIEGVEGKDIVSITVEKEILEWRTGVISPKCRYKPIRIAARIGCCDTCIHRQPKQAIGGRRDDDRLRNRSGLVFELALLE